MEAIRRYVIAPLAERLYARCVHPIAQYFAPNIERNSNWYYTALLAGAVCNVMEYREKLNSPIMLAIINVQFLLLDIIWRAVDPVTHRREGLGFGGLSGVVVYSASGYFGTQLCVEGIKAISNRIFTGVQ